MDHDRFAAYIFLPYSWKVDDADGLLSGPFPGIRDLVVAADYASNSPSSLKLESQKKVISRRILGQFQYPILVHVA
jgi:hypothetical protein